MMDLDSMEVGETIVDPIEEAREAWMEKRRGKITCSKFGVLIGEGRAKDGQFTQTGYAYLREVAAEKLGSYLLETSAPSLRWGTENERHAIAGYAARTQNLVHGGQFDFFDYDSGIGGTPDGLVGDDGCIEVKCPHNPGVHVRTLIERVVPKEYIWQCYGHLLVTGRKWCDFVSFDPRVDGPHGLCIVRVNADDKKLAFLRERLELAAKTVEEMVEAVQ